MKESFFVSKLHPEMNPFWTQLERAIKNLPKDQDPNSACLGFYLCEHNFLSDILNTEMIGVVSQKKRNDSRAFATEKVVMTLCSGEMRSRIDGQTGAFNLWPKSLPRRIQSTEWRQDILEICPGAMSLGLSCVGVDGYDLMVDEAIAILWLAAMGQMDNPLPFRHPNFYGNLHGKICKFSAKYLPDNPWPVTIAELMSGI